MEKQKKNYNVRIIDNGDGTFELGYVTGLDTKSHYDKSMKIWVQNWRRGNKRKMARLLHSGNIVGTSLR